jgi:hypothetical protein
LIRDPAEKSQGQCEDEKDHRQGVDDLNVWLQVGSFEINQPGYFCLVNWLMDELLPGRGER